MRHLCDVTPAGAARYPVWSGRDAATALARLWDARWRQAAIIGDETTLALFAAPLADKLREIGCRVLSLGFAPGEASKTRATKQALEDALLAADFDRQACIVAVGGGVALDLAGFVAATYLRGIAHVNVATTLLAQVDAAVGGKTAVNTPHGKNLIGAFHHPRAVLIDVGALASLPGGEMAGGLAETVKHAMLRDADLFADLEAWARTDRRVSPAPPEAIIGRAVAIKAEVIAADDRDQGMRNILNFGHTVGHAIEAATDHAMVHGQAIGAGMVIEAVLAVHAGWCDERAAARLEELLARLEVATRAPCSFDAARPFFVRDKKTAEGQVQCALPSAVGKTAAIEGRWTRSVTMDQLREAWR